MKYIKRLKIILWLPYVILFFPIAMIVGTQKTDRLADWIIEDVD